MPTLMWECGMTQRRKLLRDHILAEYWGIPFWSTCPLGMGRLRRIMFVTSLPPYEYALPIRTPAMTAKVIGGIVRRTDRTVLPPPRRHAAKATPTPAT